MNLRNRWQLVQFWLTITRLRYAICKRKAAQCERRRVEAKYGDVETIPLPAFLSELVRAAVWRLVPPAMFVKHELQR